MERSPYQTEEEKRKKQMQNSMIVTIVFMIIALSLFAAITPAFGIDGRLDPNKVQFQWLFIGVIAAFIIFLVSSRGAVVSRQIRCTNCDRYIPGDSNLCPYCGKTVLI